QGDQAMRAAQFRNQTGFNGAGVTVGVLSDSVNQFAGGLADSIATGDLPSNVVVLLDDTGGSDEGRAMLEIVHDLAPGANPMFRTAVLGAADFAQGIRDLFAAGATVITDDIGYANSPFFNDGVIALAATEVFDQGALYTTAAGNVGDEGFRTTWASANTTIDGVTGTFFTFGSGDFLQNLTIATGDTLQINVQWDNAFLEDGSALPNFQVGTNIDVHLLDNTGNIVATWDDVNPTTDEALEFVSYTNTGTNTDFALAFQLVSGPAPTRLAWTNFGGDNVLAQGQGATTIFGQVAARGAMATGAVNALDGTIQPYTALGGNLEILFSADGTRLSIPEIRRKPEVAGSDNVNTTFFGTDDPNDSDTFPNFSGTSAAAPHVAAAAALIFSQEPRATNEDVFTHLQLTARDLGDPGFDFLTGAGLVQLTPIRLAPMPNMSDNNETADQAVNLGLITLSQNLTGNISVNGIGLPEYDWFTFTTPGGKMQVSSRLLTGQTLEMNVYREVAPGSLVLISRSDVTSRTARTTFDTTAGVKYYVEMKGKNLAPGVITQGDYRLSIRRSV
ncbi:MAG: S8 family serine peptidase, partial [Gemmataceae bacterium]